MLMRSTMFPFSLILKSILKSLRLIFIYLNYCRYSVSIWLTVEPLSVLIVRNESQSLDVVLSFFIYFCFQIFCKTYKKFLVYLIVRLIWQ